MSSIDYSTEALVMQKHPFRERDVIVKLLARNGQLLNMIFYGGRGGGVKKKSSLIELGHCLKIELKKKKLSTDNLLVAKEWSLKWNSDKIRLNHNAFYLMNFMFEILLKLHLESDEMDEEGEHKELYVLLSNALFFLQKSLEKGAFVLNQHLNIFLVKLLYNVGILPDTEHCVHCQKELRGTFIFEPGNGGFSCCFSEGIKKFDIALAQSIHQAFKTILPLKYEEALALNCSDSEVSKALFHFYCYQFHFQKQNFKSAQMIF